MWIELLASKSEALRYFKKIKAAAEVESGHRLKAFRTDRGGEFNSGPFISFCDESGIKHNTTTPYSPQQNGVVERRNQTVVEMARCLLKSMQVPAKFWGEAVRVAVYLLNRSPTKSLKGKTPFEAWYGKKPGVRHLRTFGCLAFAKRVGPGVTKLSDRSTRGVFLGYETGSKGYRVYDPVNNKLIVTRGVIFDETKGWNWVENGGESSDSDSVSATFSVQFFDTEPNPTTKAGPDSDDGASPLSPQAIPSAGGEPHTPPGQVVPGSVPIQWVSPPTDASEGSDEAPRRYRMLSDILDSSDEVQGFEYSGACFLAADEPKSVDDALTEAHWREAMQAEMKSIEENRTWDVSELPAKQKAIGLKWVFKVKKDPNGNIVKYKARLVAKGYAQRHGVDFDEVFAPVARIETVRVLLALAAQDGWQVHHMDVKSAFLNGDLSETVYVQQPPGFRVGDGDKVLKLRKALYGLKQAPRAWYAKLDRELQALGFVRSKLEHAVYVRRNSRSFLLVGVYVDDLIISGPNVSDIEKFKQEMKKKFSMSDLGLLSYYLGIEVKQDEEGITLSQSGYAGKILEAAGMTNCNGCETPMEARLKLHENDDEAGDPTAYRSIIGSLRYIVSTRPDLAYSVGVVSRYMEAPNKEHWAAVKHILRYLKVTASYGCKYVR